MNENRTVSAHPTKYRGIQFRSRLEATWAAFFDEVGWPWEYEALELDGYIPDFILRFTEPLLAEVKPASTQSDLLAVADGLKLSGWDGEALVVGIGPYPCAGYMDGLNIGVLGDSWGGEETLWWDGGHLFQCERCQKFSVRSDVHSYRCRVCGVNDHHWGDSATEAVWARWATAKNAVQWRAPR